MEKKWLTIILISVFGLIVLALYLSNNSKLISPFLFIFQYLELAGFLAKPPPISPHVESPPPPIIPSPEYQLI